ncbi:MAG: AEC family transporter, partial [Peptococcaceae bacterium]|nr:AEC family transporter [Peptococcaceae bacterium]
MGAINFQNLYLSFEVVFPLMVYMMMGFIAGKMKLWDEKNATVFNRVVFTLFLPILLFENIRTVDLDLGVDFGLILFAIVSILITIAVLCFLVPRFEKENSRRGVMVQGIFRSNFIIFGMVMTKTILGPAEKGYSAFMMVILIPLFNVLAILSLEIFRGNKIDWPRILRNLITNPFIVTSVLGLIVLLGRISIPPLILTTTSTMGRAATPMALAAMGGCFRFGGAKNCMKQLVTSVCGKLLVMPAIWLTIAAACFGFRGEPFVCLLTLYAAPAAVSSYSLAQLMGGDGELASQI